MDEFSKGERDAIYRGILKGRGGRGWNIERNISNKADGIVV